MVQKKRCFFCGEENNVVLREYRLYVTVADKPASKKVILCSNCFMKLSDLLYTIRSYVAISNADETFSPYVGPSITRQVGMVLELIEELERKGMDPVPIDQLLQAAAEKKLGRDMVINALNMLKDSGHIYEPKPNFIKCV